MKQQRIDISNKHERHQFTAYVGHVFSEMGLLGEYENAINIIKKDLKSTKTRIDTVAHPVLYMMRHSLELGYKSNFEYMAKYSCRQTSKSIFGSHNLNKLHVEFKEHFDIISSSLGFNSDLISEFLRYYDITTVLLDQLGATEISSFRYTKDSKGHRIFQSADTKDVGEIKEKYDKAMTMLAHTSNLIAPYTDYKDLIDKIPTFEGGIGIVLMTFPSFQLNQMVEEIDKQYEKIDQLKWKSKNDDECLILVTAGNNSYLTPVRNEKAYTN